MGIQHGLTRYVLLLALVLGGCSHKGDDDKRRALLAPVDLRDKQRELYEKLRFYDAAGELMASDQKVAGIVLPRGLTPTFTFEREWYFESKLPRAKLQKYFRDHLDGGELSYPNPDMVELLKATPKDTAGALPVLVRVYPLPAMYDVARVYIRQAAPAPARWPSEAEVKAQMALRQSHLE